MTDISFSIIIPTFNRPKLLDRALTSLENQSFRNFEVIVVDDGSAVPVFMRREYEIPSIKIVRHDVNGGVAKAYNTGIRESTGRILSILNDDDEYFPDFLNQMNKKLEENPHHSFGWSSVTSLDYGEVLNECNVTERIFKEFYNDERELLLETVSIGGGFGLSIRREVIEKIGGFDESFSIIEDGEILYRMLDHGLRPVIVPSPLVLIHNHGGPRASDNSNNLLRAEECGRVIKKYHDLFNRLPFLRDHLEGFAQKLVAQDRRDNRLDLQTDMQE